MKNTKVLMFMAIFVLLVGMVSAAPVINSFTVDPEVPEPDEDVEICADVYDATGVSLAWDDSVNSGTLAMINNSGTWCRELSAGTLNPSDATNIAFDITATNGVDADDVASSDYDYDGENPTADAAGDYTCFEGTTIGIHGGNSTDTVDGDLDYAWELNDDSAYDDNFTAAADYYCSDDGDYVVFLKVTDDGLHTDFDSATVTVNNVAPTADACGDDCAADDYACDEGETITLDGTDSTDPGVEDVLTYLWDFDGDGLFDDAAGSSPAYTCGAGDGTVNDVALRVSDDDGGDDAHNVTVTVSNGIPVVEAGTSQTVDEGEEVTVSPTFTDYVTDTHTGSVDWGDGTVEDLGDVTSPLDPLTHTYADDGLYGVTVTVTDDEGLTGGDSLTITVDNVAPIVGAPADQSAAEDVEFTLGDITFTDVGVDDTHNITVDWGDVDSDFDDGVTSPVDGWTHTYDTRGTYTVTITVYDDDGGWDSDTLEIRVYDYVITLDAEWNTFSFPLVPEDDDTAITSIFTAAQLDMVESIWSFQEGEWIYWRDGDGGSTLSDLVPGNGYSVHMVDGETIDLFLDGEKMYYADDDSRPSTPPSVVLTPGWNLIGHYGENGDISKAAAFTTFANSYATLLNLDGITALDLDPFFGYWLFITGSDDVEYAPSDVAYCEDTIEGTGADQICTEDT